MSARDVSADAETFEEIQDYYRTRPFNPQTTRVIEVVPKDYGALAYIEHEGKLYGSIYLRHSMRGQGAYRAAFERELRPIGLTILTQPACNLESYCQHQGIPVRCIPAHVE